MVIGWIFGVVALVVAVFFVAWYFYIHDHAARTSGGVEAALARVAPGGAEATCRERDESWRCTLGKRTVVVVRDGKKNCWRVPKDKELHGCVKVLDYVQGLL
jgi:hypothetical protein